jgi:ubiquinone/menaquinone biosynthesis C-methylase UbiE
MTVAYYDWWVSQIFAEIPAAAQGPLVELMCGGAEVSRRLPARFDSAFALDLNVDSTEMAAVELAQRGEKRVTLVCGTAAKVPLPDACTDVVIIQERHRTSDF